MYTGVIIYLTIKYQRRSNDRQFTRRGNEGQRGRLSPQGCGQNRQIFQEKPEIQMYGWDSQM